MGKADIEVLEALKAVNRHLASLSDRLASVESSLVKLQDGGPTPYTDEEPHRLWREMEMERRKERRRQREMERQRAQAQG